MKRLSLFFSAPRQVSIQEQALPEPGPEQVLVQTLYSAISPGTEMLIYRGEFPQDLAVDESLAALPGEFGYPLKYGYSAAGRVIAAGNQVDSAWEGRLVFAFQPHESHFIARPQELVPLPPGIQPEDAVFFPNMETAVNFLMDGAPLIGEKVAVFGQGIVGLLTTGLLVRFPLAGLVTLDPYPLRRQASLQAGAQASFAPDEPAFWDWARENLPSGADLVYEISGSPAALNQAIALAGFAGRVVIGSWYGKKAAELDLGGRFHRSRIRLISSQVSSLAPEFSARWSKERRFQVAWERLGELRPARWITHRFPIEQAAQAYQLLDLQAGQAIQVIFTYPPAE